MSVKDLEDIVRTLPFDLANPYGLNNADKSALLIENLNNLTEWHKLKCPEYAAMVSRLFPHALATKLDDLAYLPVRLFKSLDLASIAPDRVIKTLTSSGTSGQQVSRIFLDRETSVRQTNVLTAIMASFLGKQRQPMLIADNPNLLKDRKQFSARAAGILGFSVFGRKHFYCLNENFELDLDGLQNFLDLHRDTPILIFGFTFVVWQGLLKEAQRSNKRFKFPSGSTLIHGGGWKRLEDQKVDNDEFKKQLKDQFGIDRVFNYYGMVEQVGSIFMECEFGHLHSPVFADVIIRDSINLNVLPNGQSGVIQVLSALPLSYPGHSLLSEDVGVIHGIDDCPCGRLGKYFSVSGRLPKVEMRGCSDTRVLP